MISTEKHILFILLAMMLMLVGVILLNENNIVKFEEQRQNIALLETKVIRMDSTIKKQQKFIDSVRTAQLEEFTWHRSP